MGLQVPIEEILPFNKQAEIIRSVPLPPPIIPETEESTPSPVSEASSGYMSNSISTITLSDVYTLSWDLPPSSGFEAVPDEDKDDCKVTQLDSFHNSLHVENQESTSIVKSEMVAERADLLPLKLESTSSDSNPSQKEPNHSSAIKSMDLEEHDSDAESHLPPGIKLNQVSATDLIGSELDNSEPLKDPTSVQKDETKQTESLPEDNAELETLQLEEPVPAATDLSDSEAHVETLPAQEDHGQLDSSVPQPEQPKKEEPSFDSTQEPSSKLVSVSVPEPPDDSVQDLSKDEETSSTSTGPEADASTKTTTAPAAPLSSVQLPKAAALVANPFKIQKVKSSDLKSFQRILGEEEGNPRQADEANLLGSGLNLSVPIEGLEIISDSEEGDAAATTVLPDWLKEGEFVTVGTNKSGIVRYVGPADFAEGTWVGVELEVPAGE